MKGCKLYDVDGKEYLDMAAGIATCCLGHSNQELKLAVTQQMEKVHHVSNIYIYIYIYICVCIYMIFLYICSYIH